MHKQSYIPEIDVDEWNERPFSKFCKFRKNFAKQNISFLEPYPQAIIEMIQRLIELDPRKRPPLE